MQTDEDDLLLIAEGPHNKGHHIFRFVVPFLLIIGALAVGLYINKSSTPRRPSDKLLKKDIKFELVESSPDDQSTSFPVNGEPTFVFSKPLNISEKDITKYFSISPSIKGNWRLEPNKQVISFTSGKTQQNSFPQQFMYDTVYKITINKGITSASGESINSNKVILFRTVSKDAQALNSNYKLLNIRVNEPSNLELYYANYGSGTTYSDNTQPIHVSVFPAEVSQVVNYFQYKNDYRWELMYYFEQKPEQHEILSFDAQPNASNGSSERISIDIPAFQQSGLYYVKLTSPHNTEDLIINVTDHVNQVFMDNDSSIVWTTDMQGKSLPGLPVSYYALNNTPKLIGQGTTDKDGIYKRNNDTSIDFVITGSNNNFAISYTDRYYELVNNHYSIYSYTDRPVYKPGDTVHTKTIVRLREKGEYKIPEGAIYYQYLDSSSSVKDTDLTQYTETQLDENGTISADIDLPKEIHGFPRIIYYRKQKDTYTQIHTQELLIESYHKPDLEITATTSEKEYISKDTAHITVSARTLYGQPLTNAAFTYRVLANSYYEERDRNHEQLPGENFSSYGYGEELTTGSGTFDAKGKAQISFSTDLLKFDQSQYITLEVTPKIGAAPSIGKLIKLVHRGEFALFFDKVESNVEDGIKGTIHVLDHKKEREPYTKTTLDITLHKIIDYSNKTLITSKSASVSAEGTIPLDLPYKDTGSYEITAKGTDERGNTVTASHTVYIGNKQEYVVQQPTASIKMTTQKSTYQPGEEATVNVRADFDLSDTATIITTAPGYTTSIDTFRISKQNPNSFEIKIPISPTSAGSIGINLFSVHEGKIVQSQAIVSVDPELYKLKTSVAFDKSEYKPGDTVKATISTKNSEDKPVSADTSLSVIDSAVLQIAGDLGNIFGSFYNQNNYYLYVSHFDSLTGIYKQSGGGGGGCFVAGTTILMADGTLKSIEDVMVGDVISTFENPQNGRLINDKVTRTFRHVVDEYLTINGSLNVTPIHRIYLNGTWQTASQARIGDKLINKDGEAVVIDSITHHTGQYVVYNLTTATTHTFIAEGIYVHNEKGMDPRHNFVDTAYWNPHVKTNEQGIASVSFKLPDNTTTFTSQVVASTKQSQFGQSIAEFISKKDVVIIPALSKYYYQNDKPVMTALVQNNSGREIQATMKLSVKELKGSVEKSIKIANNDFETVLLPVALNSNKNEVSITYELKDTASGNILDSVLVKQPLLPREDIVTDWMQYENGYTYTYNAKHPGLDVNTLSVRVAPHVATMLSQTSYNDLSSPFYYGSTSDALRIYASSIILAQTKNGYIAPSLYKYAHVKNSLRTKIADILEKRLETTQKNIWWTHPDTYAKESDGLYTTMIGIGLKEALSNGVLDEILNASDIVKKISTSVANNEVAFFKTDEESVIKRWLLGYGDGNDCTNAYISSCYASKAMRGDKKALESLRSLTVPSSDDRYFWSTPSQYTRSLPALAMILYGSTEDADKAVKGLSYQYMSYYSNNPYLALVAGVRHALRRNLDFDTPVAALYLNDKKIYDRTSDDQYNGGFSADYHAINFSNDKITVEMKHKEGLPIYTSLSTVELGSRTKKTTAAKHVITGFVRSYRSLEDGKRIKRIETGTSGIIELFAVNPVTHIYEPDDLSYTEFQLYDMIPPGFMYLNQDSNNSPEYQNTLRSIYPEAESYKQSYTSASDYTEQSVYFNANAESGTLTLPYIVYHITDGEIYRPKSSLVFPKLGIIANEE